MKPIETIKTLEIVIAINLKIVLYNQQMKNPKIYRINNIFCYTNLKQIKFKKPKTPKICSFCYYISWSSVQMLTSNVRTGYVMIIILAILLLNNIDVTTFVFLAVSAPHHDVAISCSNILSYERCNETEYDAHQWRLLTQTKESIG